MPSANDLDKFVCEQCGWCCALNGYVRLTAEEVLQIAEHLGITPEDLRERYTTIVPGDRTQAVILLDQPGTTRCVFLDDDNRCRIHAVKPRQCRTFPGDWRRSGSQHHCKGLKRLMEDQS